MRTVQPTPPRTVCETIGYGMSRVLFGTYICETIGDECQSNVWYLHM